MKFNKKKILRTIIICLIYIFIYTFVFLLIDKLANSVVVDGNHLYIYTFFAVLLTLMLTYTIKPFLVRLTLPLTGLTFGLFYFVNNMIILKLVEFIMSGIVKFTSLPILFVISILFSVVNFIINDVLIKSFDSRNKNKS